MCANGHVCSTQLTLTSSRPTCTHRWAQIAGTQKEKLGLIGPGVETTLHDRFNVFLYVLLQLGGSGRFAGSKRCC